MKSHEITTTVSHRISPTLVPGARRFQLGDGDRLIQAAIKSVRAEHIEKMGEPPPPGYEEWLIHQRLTKPLGKPNAPVRRRRYAPRDGRTVVSHGRVEMEAIVEKVTDGCVRLKTPKGSIGWSVYKHRHPLVQGDKVTVRGELMSSASRGNSFYIKDVEIIP